MRTKSFCSTMSCNSVIESNNEEEFSKITEKTACVIAETIQGAAGFLTPSQNYFKNLKKDVRKLRLY